MKMTQEAWFIVDMTGRKPRLLPWTGSGYRKEAWSQHLHTIAGWSEAEFAGHERLKEHIRKQRRRGELVAVKAAVSFEVCRCEPAGG